MTMLQPIKLGDHGAQVARLSDGRLHFHHGPIDLIAKAWGDAPTVRSAERAAAERFSTILAELCSELPALRAQDAKVIGPVAQIMAKAVAPFRPAFITPMAAVAGAVANAIVSELAIPGIDKAYANNGGDIALYLAEDQTLNVAIAARPGLPDRITVSSRDPFRGIATSGWRGRSWSMGIADSVTVVAKTAAEADAAATMIANEINLPDHPAIVRRPANSLQADSDLGARLVTVDVPPLTDAECVAALDRGHAFSEHCMMAGLIEGAALFLQGRVRVVGQMNRLSEAKHHV